MPIFVNFEILRWPGEPRQEKYNYLPTSASGMDILKKIELPSKK